jgi:hypothetical protein
MSTDIHEASEQLFRHLNSQSGSLNVFASNDASGPIIRVLIDPRALPAVGPLPYTYFGFKIVVSDLIPSHQL